MIALPRALGSAGAVSLVQPVGPASLVAGTDPQILIDWPGAAASTVLDDPLPPGGKAESIPTGAGLVERPSSRSAQARFDELVAANRPRSSPPRHAARQHHSVRRLTPPRRRLETQHRPDPTPDGPPPSVQWSTDRLQRVCRRSYGNPRFEPDQRVDPSCWCWLSALRVSKPPVARNYLPGVLNES